MSPVVSNGTGPSTGVPTGTGTTRARAGSAAAKTARPRRRPRGPQPDVEQAQKLESLALRHQVGAIEQRLGEPGEQLDQRATRIARLRVGPFGGVRRQPAQQLRSQLLRGEIGEREARQRHGGPAQPVRRRVSASVAGRPSRRTR